MARGQADFGALAAKEVSASVSDMGEVAARLGSIVTYDKRGDVVDFDNFEEPILKWNIDATDGSVYLDSTDVKSGSQSLALSTNAVTGAFAGVKKYVALTVSKRLGIEISMGGELVGKFYMELTYNTGTYLYYIELLLDFDNRELYILDGDTEELVLIASLAPFFYGRGYHFFYTLKIVCDFETGKYIRVLFSNCEWDISAIKLFRDTFVAAPHLQVDIWRENVIAEAYTTFIDDFVFTQAEP